MFIPVLSYFCCSMYFSFLADVIPRGIDEMLLDAFLTDAFSMNKKHVLFRAHKHAMLPNVASAAQFAANLLRERHATGASQAKLDIIDVNLECGSF